MTDCKWREFVEDDNGRGSASRLNMMIGVLIGSFTVVWLTLKGNLGGEIFATFMLATGGVYGFGKWQDSKVQTEQIKADSPNPQPAPIVTLPAPVNTTNINVSQQPTDGKGDTNASS